MCLAPKKCSQSRCSSAKDRPKSECPLKMHSALGIFLEVWPPSMFHACVTIHVQCRSYKSKIHANMSRDHCYSENIFLIHLLKWCSPFPGRSWKEWKRRFHCIWARLSSIGSFHLKGPLVAKLRNPLISIYKWDSQYRTIFYYMYTVATWSVLSASRKFSEIFWA